MSKVKLVIAEGYGTYTNPFTGNAGIINSEVKVPDTHNILGVVRTEFDPEKDGVRISDDLAPVVYTEGVNHLVGKLLTLADSSFSDQEQRKAFKDLVIQTTWDWYHGHRESLVPPWRKDKGISVQ